MSQPELVRRWMRCCLRTLVHAQRNIDYVQSQDRSDSYVVLQSNLWDEAQEYGVQFNQYVIHASRRSYFHRNEHWSLTRPTHQILYGLGREVGVFFLQHVRRKSLTQILTVWMREMDGFSLGRNGKNADDCK